jgi:hypothetical protein
LAAASSELRFGCSKLLRPAIRRSAPSYIYILKNILYIYNIYIIYQIYIYIMSIQWDNSGTMKDHGLLGLDHPTSPLGTG